MAHAHPAPGVREEVRGEGAYLESLAPNLEVREAAAVYRPRNAAVSVLYGVVAGHLETFLDGQHRRDRCVPRFVERELRSFLDCGVLARGFLRVHCDTCSQDRLLPYSCKGRGFCPSCGGRRMADTAAHLVDRVFPEVPVRQWVLSLPFTLRYRLAYDSSLVRDVLQIFVRAVFASIRRRAGVPASNRRARCGAVTFVQRFGDALNLNLHLHTLVLDGIYLEDDQGYLAFRYVAPPSDGEVARVARRVHRRVVRLLERRGLGPEAGFEEADDLRRNQPLLAELYGASISSRIAAGPHAGSRVARAGDVVDPEEPGVSSTRRCAAVAGFSVHADVCVPPHDRARLERLCRYTGRPPVATERLSRLPDGKLLYRLRHRWRDGTRHVIFEPLDLVAKLAALVPPPRFNLVRYHGVLAPSAAFRPLVIPEPENDSPPPHPATTESIRAGSGSGGGTSRSRPRNYSWSQLMARIFAVDVLKCSRCGARMRIIAAIHPPEAIRKILECLGLPSRPPPVSRATGLDDPSSW